MQNGCIWTNWFYLWKIGSIWAKVVLCGQKLLYLGKIVVFGQNWFYLGKMVVFRENGCICTKLVLFEPDGCIWVKLVLFGQIGSIWDNFLVNVLHRYQLRYLGEFHHDQNLKWQRFQKFATYLLSILRWVVDLMSVCNFFTIWFSIFSNTAFIRISAAGACFTFLNY